MSRLRKKLIAFLRPQTPSSQTFRRIDSSQRQSDFYRFDSPTQSLEIWQEPVRGGYETKYRVFAPWNECPYL